MVDRSDTPSKDIARQLRELADLVERRGLHEGSLDIEDGADFVRGSDPPEMRLFTRVEIELKIIRR